LLAGSGLLILFSCVNKNEQQAKSIGQEIYFPEMTYNYGEIEEGSDGTCKLEFKNIGNESIVINNVRSSCGCTATSWPKDPIASGVTGEIEVKYNTALKGSFMKTVYVYSTASNSPEKLIVKGKVIPKPKPEQDHTKPEIF